MFTGRRGLRRTTRFGSGVFSPRSLPGLAAWYRADLGITIGTGVSAWADQSGTGDANKNLTQATGSAQPTRNLSDAAYNNKPTLSFVSASSQSMTSAAWAASLSTPYTMFVVGNDDGSATVQQFTDNQFAAAAESGVIENNGAAYFGYSGTLLGSGVAPSNAPKVFGFVSGASGAIYVSARTAKATGNAGTNAQTGITAGASTSNTFMLNGKIAEIIFYSGALSQSAINQVLAYLGARYAIAIGS